MVARTWRSGGVIAAIGLVAVLALACGGGKAETQEPTATRPPATQPAATQPPTAASPTAASGPGAVSIIDFSYAPAQLTVRAGQKVTLALRNSGQFPHSFTIDGLVDSGTIASGASKTIEFTATQAGTLTFYCTIHGKNRMSGTLAVSGPGAAGQPNASDPGSGASVGTKPPSEKDDSSGY